MPASFCVAIMMLLLRFGPRGLEDGVKEDDLDELDIDMAKHAPLDMESGTESPQKESHNYLSIQNVQDMASETASLTSSIRRAQGLLGDGSTANPSTRASVRKRQAALGSMV